ncbi:hypothetical protein PQ610_06205 [Tardisphaera miroshnichenkoae]
MPGYDLEEFQRVLNERWKDASGKDRLEALLAYVSALENGMDPSLSSALVDFLSSVGFACPDLGAYFARYGVAEGSTISSLSSLPAQLKTTSLRLPFLSEKRSWSASELRERLLSYADFLKQGAVAWQTDRGFERGSDGGPVQRAHEAAGSTSARPPSEVNRYFYELVRLKGPSFTEKLEAVAPMALRLGVQGFFPFVSGAASSLGIKQSDLDLMFKGPAGGKAFPDVVLELLSQADVDDYVVAYAYVLISEWFKRQGRRSGEVSWHSTIQKNT